jgi:hypothetical protein
MNPAIFNLLSDPLGLVELVAAIVTLGAMAREVFGVQIFAPASDYPVELGVPNVGCVVSTHKRSLRSQRVYW